MQPTAPTAHIGPEAARVAMQPVLGVKRPAWRSDGEVRSPAGAEFDALVSSIGERDGFRCAFCGFTSERFQEVHHVDGDHDNASLHNLLTSCNVCHQVHHLGASAINGGGFLAMLPEITQTEVNHLARLVFVARTLNEPAVGERLASLYAVLQQRGTDTLRRVYGFDISVFDLAQCLASMKDGAFANRASALQGMRLVPTEHAFSAEQLEFYAATQAASFRADGWLALRRGWGG